MILLPSEDADELALWNTLLDLADRADGWTLIGARMVELHAAETGRQLMRTSLDGDVLADARRRPNPVRRVAQLLIAEEFKLRDSYRRGPWGTSGAWSYRACRCARRDT